MKKIGKFWNSYKSYYEFFLILLSSEERCGEAAGYSDVSCNGPSVEEICSAAAGRLAERSVTG